MQPSRRNVLFSFLCGAGGVGLRSMVSGIPVAWLLDPRRALAASAEAGCEAIATKPQFLVLSTSSAGDPVNANAPGTYVDARAQHSADPQMVKTSMKLGSQTYEAAKPWASLPADVLARTSFFHHATLTNSHLNQSKVMRLMGQTRRQEMLVSMYAKQLAPCLGTIQREPVVVGAENSSELLSFEGRTLPHLSPRALKAVLARTPGPLTDLQTLRDRDLDKLNALFKEHGTNTQRQFLDRLALSQTEARAIPQQLLDTLSGITADDMNGQVVAACALIKMKVAPVVSIHIPFGSDNHTDIGLARETAAHVSGTAWIAKLMQTLKDHQLYDNTTFALMNVFGRTLASKGTNGRDHHPAHAVGVMIGKAIKPSVIGGIAFDGIDFAALPIDSESGAGDAGGDITYDATMGSLGKTLGSALGIGHEVLDQEIMTGKIVRAAVTT